ncbi:MAG: dTMP kinase [Arthrobacter sp.]|uniref:dTMP kinase n=1 Tax=Arthrobacter sp. TaxID=1667 RepID=UPI003499E234
MPASYPLASPERFLRTERRADPAPIRLPAGSRGHRTIVVLGADGSGKTTAAAGLVASELGAGRPAQHLRNPAGRRWLARVTGPLGPRVPPRWADRFESAVRTLNVLAAHARAARFVGVTVMDRHLACQLVLRRVRGLPPGLFLPWLERALPRPDAVVLLDVPAETAHARIAARGEDSESLGYLRAARTEYLALAASRGWHVVDAGGSPDEVVDRVLAAAGPAPTRLAPAGLAGGRPGAVS